MWWKVLILSLILERRKKKISITSWQLEIYHPHTLLKSLTHIIRYALCCGYIGRCILPIHMVMYGSGQVPNDVSHERLCIYPFFQHVGPLWLIQPLHTHPLTMNEQDLKFDIHQPIIHCWIEILKKWRLPKLLNLKAMDERVRTPSKSFNPTSSMISVA